MSYKAKFQPRVEDVDQNGKFSLEAAVRMFETAGILHSASVGENVIDDSLAGTSWIVAEWRVELYAQPDRTRLLTAETYAWGRTPASIVYRDYTLTDDAGAVIAKGSAKLGLFDRERGRLIRITPEYHEQYAPGDRSVFETAVARLREQPQYEHCAVLPMRRTDMDFNGHVHNTCYLRYAFEGLPREQYDAGGFSAFRIAFHRPITELQNVTVRSNCGEDCCSMAVYDEAGQMCALVELRRTPQG